MKILKIELPSGQIINLRFMDEFLYIGFKFYILIDISFVYKTYEIVEMSEDNTSIVVEEVK